MKPLSDEDVEYLRKLASDPSGLRGDFERFVDKQEKDSKFNTRLAIAGLIVATLTLIITVVQLVITLH